MGLAHLTYQFLTKGGLNMARTDEVKYKLHSDEYMEFVKTNKRLPDDRDRFSTGTKMKNWRRYAKTIVQDQNIIMFDEDMKKEFDDMKRLRKMQSDYDEITSYMRREGDPQTLEEYLKGNNKYHYFNISTYIEIMRTIITPSKEELILLRRLQLILAIYHDKELSWDEFNNEYDITCIGDDIMKIVNDLSDRERIVITYKYGLDTGELMSDDYIASILYTKVSNIRNIVAKALRRLSHPNRIGRLRKNHEKFISRGNRVTGPIKDHWFVVNVKKQGVHEYVKMIIHRPICEMEEVFNKLYEKASIDVIDPKSEYKILSVKTYKKYAYAISSKLVSLFGIPNGDISGNVVYEYTEINIHQKLSISSEEYIKRQLSIQQDKIEEAEINKDFQSIKREVTNPLLDPINIKERIQQAKDMRFIEDNFEPLFSVACSRICANIEFDSDYKWISEFNSKIREYEIPISCVKNSADIFRSILYKYLDEFIVICKYLPIRGKMCYYMYLDIVSEEDA